MLHQLYTHTHTHTDTRAHTTRPSGLQMRVGSPSCSQDLSMNQQLLRSDLIGLEITDLGRRCCQEVKTRPYANKVNTAKKN